MLKYQRRLYFIVIWTYFKKEMVLKLCNSLTHPNLLGVQNLLMQLKVHSIGAKLVSGNFM